MKLASILSFVLALGIFSVDAFAHDQHCHQKDGSHWADAKDVGTEKDCTAKGGVWMDHHAHCHKKGTTHEDIKDAKDEKTCKTKGGEWTDHGHTGE